MRLRGVAVGAGYFSQFHYDAWHRNSDVVIRSVCDRDPNRALEVQSRYSLEHACSDYREAMDQFKPDFVDIITPPSTHLEIVTAAAQRGIHVICQKPLAATLDEARVLVDVARAHKIRLMVHENFRFQPWHREIRRLLSTGEVGDRLFSLTFRTRTGDGWGDDAYLGRQPYFRDMPRLLIFETGIHFIDTFRFLAGEVARVECLLRRLNPVIKGEDCGLMILEFANGCVGLWDANRYNPVNASDPRLTLGEFLVETNGGTIRLYADGRLTIQKLGGQEVEHAYPLHRRGFGGDCVYTTQQHFTDCLLGNLDFETDGQAYLRNLEVQEACYASAMTRQPISI